MNVSRRTTCGALRLRRFIISFVRLSTKMPFPQVSGESGTSSKDPFPAACVWSTISTKFKLFYEPRDEQLHTCRGLLRPKLQHSNAAISSTMTLSILRCCIEPPLPRRFESPIFPPLSPLSSDFSCPSRLNGYFRKRLSPRACRR